MNPCGEAKKGATSQALAEWHGDAQENVQDASAVLRPLKMAQRDMFH